MFCGLACDLSWRMFSVHLKKMFSSVQSLSRVLPFATPWTAACQASLSITNSRMEKNVFCCFWMECSLLILSGNVSFKISVSLLIFCLYVTCSLMLVNIMSFTIIVLSVSPFMSVSPFISINVCFIYLGFPVLCG